MRITVETSKICNLKCRYCCADAGNPYPNELSYDEIISVIDQAKTFGARSVILIGGGEPLMYKRYFDLVDYINDNGMIPSSFTNCTLITKETAKRLYEKNVTITGKMNSFDENKQDYLVGVKGASKKIWKGF